MSAFYSTIAQSNGPAKKIKTKTRVSVVHMPFGLTPSSVVADAASPPTSKLRPDYIALKPDLKGGYEWYVAEAKGTDALLANYTVGTNHPWCLQAKNCEIQVNTVPQTVSRRIVVATRVNPGAVKRETRIIQARAWNSYDPSPRRLDPQAVAEMAGVHLFGLFYNLGRPAIARSIVDALDAFGERSGRKRKVPDLERRRANEDAVRSIEQLPRQFRSRGFASTTEVRLPVETREGVADVWLNPAFTDLALQFISADSAEEVAEAVTEAEGQLSASADRDALLTSAGSSDYRIPRRVSVDLPDIRESRRPFSR
jgi:hypothetical protein